MVVVLTAALVDAAHGAVQGFFLLPAIFWRGTEMHEWVIQAVMPLTMAALFLVLTGWVALTRRTWAALACISTLFTGLMVALGAWNYYPSPSATTCVLLLPLAYYLALLALYQGWRAWHRRQPLPPWVYAWGWLVAIQTGLLVAIEGMLRINGRLLPLTFDAFLHHIDQALPPLAPWAASWVLSHQAPPWLVQATIATYDVLAIVLFAVLALLVRESKARSLQGWRSVLLPFALGAVCYIVLPATGPVAAMPGYPGPTPADFPPGLLSVHVAARNAMPSLHLASALWIVTLCAGLRRKWMFGLSLAFALGTAWATLAMGEHYLIDLVVALPFAAALGLRLMNPPRWQQAPRWQHGLQWAVGGTFVLWMLLLRLTPVGLIAHPGLVQLLSAWSVAASLALLTMHVSCVWREEDTHEPLLAEHTPVLARQPFVAPALLPAELQGQRWLVGIFFFSGFAGLVYEVVYAKALGITFGGTALAANTVLMTYMGGMALGAWLGGILAERTQRPLLLYAYFEAVIGLYAAITPGLFGSIQSLYVALALDAPPDAAWLTALRMGLGAAVLGVPTVLMGATLPLVFKCLQGMGIPTARAIAPLYAANVVGAAVGALVAGYALLPAVGRDGGTLLAAAISLLVALFVIGKNKRIPYGASAVSYIFNSNPHAPGKPPILAAPIAPVAPPPGGHTGLVALAVLTAGGIVTLALEVVFMHLLAVVAGNSVYAFGLMLATFLLGLGLGSALSEALMRHHGRAKLMLAAQCGIALALVLTAFVWDGLADYMGSFAYAQRQGVVLSFAARELIRALVCTLAMLPPAFCIGMGYPAAMGLAADWLAARRFGGQTARGVGLASALNTLGNIAGVLLAGFWWLPQYGSNRVLFGLAVVAVLLAALVAWSLQTPAALRKPWPWLPVGSMAAGLLLFPTQWNYTALSTGGNVYFYPQAWGEVIDHAESVEGGMTTVAKTGENHLTLLTNGKFQGNNAEGGEMVAQESIALIPLMHQAKRDAALVIGYGTGMTARVLQEQGFAHLDVAETSRDIVTMADRHFYNINANISSNPSVTMHYTDGRNYLLTQFKQFDLISLEISSIWFAGAANLYNREFYELANIRLRPQGVLQQWVQLHHMRPVDFLYIMGSVRTVFKYVWVYVSGGQGIIVASNDATTLHTEAPLRKLMHSHTISSLKITDLPHTLVAGPRQIDALIARFDPKLIFFVSTDKNMYLEYATPKGNAMSEDSMPQIIDLLKGKK